MLVVEPAELRALASGTAPPTEAPAFPGRDLRLGNPLMNGPDVKAWQTRLLSLGWTVIGTADGAFGQHTDAATRGFQAAAGLRVDGIVGATTWGAAWSPPAHTAPVPAPSTFTPAPAGTATVEGSFQPAGK